MPNKVVQESRRSSRPVGDNGRNGHAVQERSQSPQTKSSQSAADSKVLLVSQEIMRLVDASREGRLTRTRNRTQAQSRSTRRWCSWKKSFR